MNSCMNLSTCTHLQFITQGPALPPRASIFHGALPVMEHVHEWDGEITVRIGRAVGDKS